MSHRRRHLVLAALLACACTCTCASAPGAHAAAELSLTAAAEAWTAWLDAETAVAEAETDDSARSARLDRLAALNAEWDVLEAAFNAAWSAYDAARRTRAVSLPDAERRCRAALDRAYAFLHAAHVLR